MHYYQTTTQFNCGIDLRARQMYVCVVDRQGAKLRHPNLPPAAKDSQRIS